ncbi:MAG: 50S ribosomal protein L4 [Terriglobales bacterium]
MATIAIQNLQHQTVGQCELADQVFLAPVNEELLWEAVRHYTAAQRRGTHQTKGRGEVRGSGRKLWRQKGTGRARIGSVRSPLWRHGGTVHGPHPRSYAWVMPKKKLKAALRSALAAKFRDAELVVVDGWMLPEVKTRNLRAALDGFDAGRGALLVDAAAENRNLALSARNLPNVQLLTPAQVHPYHLLRYPKVILSQPALEVLQRAALPVGKRAPAA